MGSSLGLVVPLESPIPGHERLQHVRDQRRRIDRFAIRLHVQRGVVIKVSLQARPGTRRSA